MDNFMKFETNGEQKSLFLLESHNASSVVEIVNTEMFQSAVDTEVDIQQSMEMSPCLEEKGKKRIQGLFAPFSHHMRPDLEYIRLESEKSASNQEAATKVINDRYKLIMENSVRRKEKEQKDKMKFTQMSHNVDYEKVMKTTQLSICVNDDDIKKTTKLLHNMHLTPGFVAKDQPEEFSENELGNIDLYSGLDKFIKLDCNEINTTSDILDIGMIKTVAEYPECRMEDFPAHVRDEQKDGENRIIYQVSQKPGSAKCKKANQIFWDGNEFIGSSFEELLGETFESLYEV